MHRGGAGGRIRAGSPAAVPALRHLSGASPAMTAAATRFYVTGGTLRHDAPSYVVRQADTDLYQELCRGEFCYLLTSRQMGKSSLMVHTAARLRQEGVAVAILDLTGIGQNLSPEQWYGGLLRLLGHQLDPSGALEDDLEEFWFAHDQLGPLQRWLTGLREVVLKAVDSGQWAAGSRGEVSDPGQEEGRPTPSSELPTAHCPLPTAKLVIFIDEID